MNWKKTIRWVLFASFAFILALSAAAVVFVRTATFHRFVLAKIVQATDNATGGRLEIGNFTIHWTGLSVDFYDVRLRGTESARQPALFATDHLNVGITVISILRRKFTLERIVLDRPSLYLRVDAQGHSNLPQSSAKAQAADENSAVAKLFDMAIQRLIVNSGTIDYNDVQIPLSAELHDFQVTANLNNLTRAYHATIAYDRGRVEVNNFNPVVHNTQIEVMATPSGIVVNELLLTTARSRFAVSGQISDYAHPAVQASYQGSLQTGEVAEIMKLDSLPAGIVAVHGAMHYENSANKTFLDALKVTGTLDSASLLLRIEQASILARTVRGTYRIEDGNLYVDNAAAELLGGHATGKFQMLHLAGSSASRFEAALRSASLEEASRVMFPNEIRLLGDTNVTAEGGWTKSINDVSMHADIIVTGPLTTTAWPTAVPQTGASRGPGSNHAISVNAGIDVRYDGLHSTASFDRSYIRTAAADMSLTGDLSNHSALKVQANTSDLNALTELIGAIGNASAPAGQKPSALQALALQGSAHFTGQVLGSMNSPRISGQASAENFEVEGSRWRTLKTSVDASASAIELKNASLADTQQGQINLNGRVSLSDWSFTPSSAITAQVAATHMSIADLQRLAGRHYPVTGDLSANISFDGSEQNPSGHGSLTITKASAWSEPITNLTVEFQGDGNAIHSTAQIRGVAGTVSATVGYLPRTSEYDVTVKIPGLDLGKVHAVVERNAGVGGMLTGSATGHGTLNDPQLDANLDIAHLRVRDRTIQMAQAQLKVAQQHASFTLHSDLERGMLQAKGDADLTGDKMATAELDIHALPLGMLLASYLPSGGPHFGGETDLHATLHGPWNDPARIEAHADIAAFSVGYKSAEIASARPIRLDYRGGVATLQPTEMKGSGTDLNLQGSIPIKSAAPMDVSAKGTIDLAFMKGFTPDLESSGEADLDISARGDLAHPVTQGRMQIKNASLSSAAIPVGFEMLNVQVNMQGNRLDLSQLSASAGGGNVSATGFMIYGAQTSFNMNLTAKDVRVRYPEGVRSVVDANLQLNGTPGNSALGGRVLIDRLSFTKDFDVANFMGQFSGENSAPNPSSLEQNLKMNISVQTAQDLNAESSQLSVEGSANLNVGGTLANPVILGRTSLTGGDIFFLGKRYVVQNGTIEFANTVHTEPIVNVFMSTTVQQYNITLNFVGPLDRLRTNYTSTPALPPSDIINLIAFGKTAEEQATGPATPASLGAESVLAQGVSGQVSGRIEKLAGISQLTIDPLASTSSSDPGSQIAIQQRITGALLFTFSTNVTSTQNETVQLQYQTNRNVSVSVLRDQNGGYAVDVRVRKTF